MRKKREGFSLFYFHSFSMSVHRRAFSSEKSEREKKMGRFGKECTPSHTHVIYLQREWRAGQTHATNGRFERH